MTNAGFIVAAYLAAALILAGLVGWILFAGKRLRDSLAKLEAQGVRRRSAGPKEASGS